MPPTLLPYSPHRDVYRLLGVPPTASSEEISAACRRLSRTFHPDRNRSHRATQEMQVVNVVRRVMTDPDERARYDRERRRFLDELVRASLLPSPSTGAVHIAPARPSPLEAYLRAVLVGVRAAIVSLAPPRCRSCRTVIGPDDVYCAACGTPRLTGG